MNVLKIALLGTAALVAVSVSARADSLEALKSSMNDLTIGAVADAPAAAAPATVVAWSGWVRAGIGTNRDTTNGIGAVAAGTNPVTTAVAGQGYATDIWAQGEIVANATTQTAVGEVGVNVAFRGSANNAAWGIANGADASARTDDFKGWWKMTPNLTLIGGQQGVIKSSYSWDAVATNWFFGKTQAGVLGYTIAGQSDPATMMLAYADGPLGFTLQAYDSNNVSNASAFGVAAKASYKMDAIGFDFGGNYQGNAAGPQNAYGVYGGLGYSAGAFSFGGALGTGQNNTGVTSTLGSLQAKLGLSDVARLELGVTREFAQAGNLTTVGAGLYYTPVKQLSFGLEGGYVSSGLGAAGGDGSYTAGVVTQFSF